MRHEELVLEIERNLREARRLLCHRLSRLRRHGLPSAVRKRNQALQSSQGIRRTSAAHASPARACGGLWQGTLAVRVPLSSEVGFDEVMIPRAAKGKGAGWSSSGVRNALGTLVLLGAGLVTK